MSINKTYAVFGLGRYGFSVAKELNSTIDIIYDEIGYRYNGYISGYDLSRVIVKNDNLYGIISYKDGNIIETIKYSEEEINTLLEMLNS